MSLLIPNTNNVGITNVSGVGVASSVYGRFGGGSSGSVPIEAFVNSHVISGIPTYGLVVGIAASGGKMVNTNRYGFDDGNRDDMTLLTTAMLAAFNFEDDVWARLRAYKVSSGEHDINIDTSGYALGTYSMIGSADGRLAQVFDDTVDDYGNDHNLFTLSHNIGYDSSLGQWSRLRITSSGKGMSGIAHRLAVAFSGDIIQIGQGGSVANVNDDAGFSESEGSDSLFTTAYNYAKTTSLEFSSMMVTSSGKGMSGIHHKLAVAFSGDRVVLESGFGKVSIVGTDGQVDVFDLTADGNQANNTFALATHAFMEGYQDGQSGTFARVRVTSSGKGISGIHHKLVVAFSGDNVFEHGSALITNPMRQATNASGGVILSSGSVFSVTVNNESGNDPVWIGGTGSQAPFSGKGLHVYGGGSVSLKIDSVDDVRVFAEVSGQLVSWIGVQK